MPINSSLSLSHPYIKNHTHPPTSHPHLEFIFLTKNNNSKDNNKVTSKAKAKAKAKANAKGQAKAKANAKAKGLAT